MFFRVLFFLNFLLVAADSTSQGQLWSDFLSQRITGSNASVLQLLEPTSSLSIDLPSWPVTQSKSFKLQRNNLQSLLISAPQRFILPLVSLNGEQYQLFLERQEVFGKGSLLLTNEFPQGEKLQTNGLYYRGVVNGHPGSLVAMSFFVNEIAGVISLPEAGNLVLGKVQSEDKAETESELHVLYPDQMLLVKPEFQCGVQDLEPGISLSAPDSLYVDRCKVVKIFFECDYKLYQDKNRSVNNVKNYITSLFNVVKTLYYNEGVNLEISDIMVWTSQDPFLHTDLASILYHYSNYRQNNFTGNLAQLVTTFAPQQQGGIAFLGTLCQPYNGNAGPHSFAYIYNSFSQLPSYSWSVEVMAHELGHNFGSPHTHACFWGPFRNQALDNCQPPENNGCPAGPAPTGGGTIMSYCHLTGYGINFSKGFGDEPGDVIRIAAQNRSCVSSSFTPVILENIQGPYYEDDVIILKARPSQTNYQYDWFHYDYLMPSPKDSSLHVNYTGIYTVAVSDKCTEYSLPDTIEVKDFLVNLGCPVIPGKRDSVSVSLTMVADLGTRRDSLVVPDSLFQKVPSWGRDVQVVLDMTIRPNGSSWNRDVLAAYTGPAGTGISNPKFNINTSEPAGYSTVKTYSRILGRFNPAGVWHFITNDNRPDPGIDGMVDFTIKLVWRSKDSVSSCRIALCEGQSKTLDAGIRSAQYQWSTGQTSRQIVISQPGTVSVVVTKGGKKASHEVEFYNYPRHYQQILSLCKGDSIKVGNRYLQQEGLYTDTLSSINGCDSILNTQLNLLQPMQSKEELFLCFEDTLRGKVYRQDTIERYWFVAANGCDSVHEVSYKINPKLNLQTFVQPACPEIGGRIIAIIQGGSGSGYQYLWSTGDTVQQLVGLPSGDYHLWVRDSAGCGVEAKTGLKNLDSVGLAALIFDVDCFGDHNGRIYLDFTSGLSPYHVLWSTRDTTKDLLNLSAGQYSVYVTDANGCKSQQILEVKSPDLLLVQAAIKGSTGADGTAKAIVFGGTQPYTYLWSTGDRTDSIGGLAPGTYQIWIDDQKGCKASTSFEIPQVTSSWIGHKNTSSLIIPNPVRDKLHIAITNERSLAWKIYHLGGVLVNEGVLESPDQFISVQNLPAGFYLLNGQSPDKRQFHAIFCKL